MQKFLGKRGMTALEQLMGLLLALMGMEMTVQGLTKFILSMNLN
ncbi:MAG: MarC family protein [Waddliaceae bacterium]